MRWQGYGEDEDTWEPYSHLPPSMIKEFLLANGLYDHAWPGVRCGLCDKPCKNSRGVRCHLRHCYHLNVGRDQPAQDFTNRKVEKAARTTKLKEAQKTRPTVQCEGENLENTFLFKYLGSVFAANGSQEHDVMTSLVGSPSQ